MYDPIDRVLSHFETMLRYVASGFVAVLFVRCVGLDFDPFHGIQEHSNGSNH